MFRAATVAFLRGEGEVAARVWMIAVLALVGGVYFPVTRVFFYADDFSCFATIVDAGLPYFLLHPIGGHAYLVRGIFFYLPFALFGFKAEPYAWLALITHVLNVALLFRVTRRLTGSVLAAALGALLWGTSPLQSEALGWFAAYGYVLSGTALLLTLDLALARPGKTWESGSKAALCALLLWCGAMSCGVGVGTALAFPFVIALHAPEAYRSMRPRVVLVLLPALIVGSYYGSRWLFARLYGPLPVEERMLGAMAFSSSWPVFQMTGLLLKFGTDGLLDGIWLPPSSGPGSCVEAPWWPLWAFLALVVCASSVSRSETRRSMLGLFGLALGAYGIIAVGRANLDAGAVPVHAGMYRYHYVGTLPLAMILAGAVQEVARYVKLPNLVPGALLAGWFALALLIHGTTPWKLNEYASCRRSVETTLRTIDARIDAAPSGKDVYLPNDLVPECFMYSDVADSAGLFAFQYPQDDVRGRRVHFIAPGADPVAARPPAVAGDRAGRHNARRLSALVIPSTTDLAPSSPDVSGLHPPCKAFTAAYEKMAEQLGCSSNWNFWAQMCEALVSRPGCEEPTRMVIDGIVNRARPGDPTWRCDATGRLDVDVVGDVEEVLKNCVQ